MIQWKNGMKDPLNLEDFDFDEETRDEAEDDDPLGMKISKKDKEEGNEERKGKWDAESQATRCKLAASMIITWSWVGKPFSANPKLNRKPGLWKSYM